MSHAELLKLADDRFRERLVDHLRVLSNNAEDLRAQGAKARELGGGSVWEIIACAHEDAADVYAEAAKKIERKYKAVLVAK